MMKLISQDGDPRYHIVGRIERIGSSPFQGKIECGERGEGSWGEIRTPADVFASDVCEKCLVMALAQGRDELIDLVPMTPLPEPIGGTPKHPYTIKHGHLRIGDTRIRCYELSDGQRIFSVPEVERFLASVREVQGGY